MAFLSISEPIDSKIMPALENARQTWKITKRGMDSQGYFIAADRYNELMPGDSGLSDWLLHIARKSSRAFDLEAFIEAFGKAMKKAGIEPIFDMQRSIEQARTIRRKSEEFQAIYEELYPEKHSLPQCISFNELNKRCDHVHTEIKARHARTRQSTP